MAEKLTPEEERHELLRKINNKMGWAVFLLVLITLNTCELADDLEDAIRRDEAPAAQSSAPVPSAPAQPQPAQPSPEGAS
jgi:hypothetical protein